MMFIFLVCREEFSVQRGLFYACIFSNSVFCQMNWRPGARSFESLGLIETGLTVLLIGLRP